MICCKSPPYSNLLIVLIGVRPRRLYHGVTWVKCEKCGGGGLEGGGMTCWAPGIGRAATAG